MKLFAGIYKKFIAILLMTFVLVSGAKASSLSDWDIDDNGEVDALTDALLVLRYTFGLRGDSLTSGAVATNSALSTSEIENSTVSAMVIADIDADGEVDALTDGLLLLRYAFGVRDSSLIGGAVATGATRNSSTAIENYIQRHMVDYVPTTYNFKNSTYVADSDSVSYTGQVARQLLMTGMVDYMEAMAESGKTEAEFLADLDFYMNGDGADDAATGFTLKNGAADGSDVLNAVTYGDISSGKNLDGKIAGGNGEGGGEASKLIDGEFFGWEGFEGALPIDLVDSWTATLAAQASDGLSLTIPTVDGDVNVTSVHYDAAGRNYRQLLQKFLMGAVSFSQGTNDYFQSDWATQVTLQEGPGKNYTEAEHNYDEAFGYYGAARNNNDYTDLEARAKSGRDEWKNGYHDTNGDGLIDPRSEFNFGHSQNCAKRDVASAGNTNPTDLSTEAMNAFLAGRQVIANASAAGSITDAELAELQGHIKTAALTWEKCIAATSVHYINNLIGDIAGFSNGSYASVSDFTNLGKHWSELKGFALSLQFSPFSPFRDADVTSVNLDDLKALVAAIGDAPVLATDGQAAIDAYVQGLNAARDTLQVAYSFDAENAASWGYNDAVEYREVTDPVVSDYPVAVPTTYNFKNSTYVADSDSVSYTGQVARQLLMTGMVDYMEAMAESGKTEAEFLADLDFYMNGDGADDAATGFTLKNGAADGSDVLNAVTYGDISSGKNLDGKIAGGNGEGGGEASKLIDGEFFGWEGFEGALPIDLVDSWTATLAAQASDGLSLTIPTVDGDVNVTSVQYDADGRNYRQLLQKFLMGAVSFSQGTNDYFQSDWATQVTLQEGPGKNYTEAEHNYDEAFGYYGAARNNNDYTDLEARAKSGRDEWKNGYHDTNGDGLIDPRSEFNFGHSQNCAKRDVGSSGNTNPTDLSTEAMNAFLAGRQVIANASAAGFITDAELAELQGHIKTAAVTWEKCIAATAIHYINDVTADIGEFSNGSYASVSNFTNLGKHWSELKGFALSLQFSPFSPFRDADVTAVDLNDLKSVYSLIGTAPVLATSAQVDIDAYLFDLENARSILQAAYGFDAENVANW